MRPARQAPTAELYQKWLCLQTELDLASTSKGEQLLFKSQHTFFEFGDKAGKLLAHQACQAAALLQINQIKTTSGLVTTDHKEINDAFVPFFVNLYSSDYDNGASELVFFFFFSKFEPASP